MVHSPLLTAAFCVCKACLTLLTKSGAVEARPASYRSSADPGSAHVTFILQGVDDLPRLRADDSVDA
jgi:hypothetical protein